MALILIIDTSTEFASLCLAENEECLCLLTNNQQKDHASWLHVSIKQAFNDTGKKLQDLQAVGITNGPGSYTGLRVGMASAKGLCYALKIPLLTLNTLEAMACIAVSTATDYICPLIDARRMEVYTAVYDKSLNEILAPSAMILDNRSFFQYLDNHALLFFGNGKAKLQKLIDHSQASFTDLSFNASNMIKLIYVRYHKSEFVNLVYIEPLYLKN